MKEYFFKAQINRGLIESSLSIQGVYDGNFTDSSEAFKSLLKWLAEDNRVSIEDVEIMVFNRL